MNQLVGRHGVSGLVTVLTFAVGVRAALRM